MSKILQPWKSVNQPDAVFCGQPAEVSSRNLNADTHRHTTARTDIVVWGHRRSDSASLYIALLFQVCVERNKLPQREAKSDRQYKGGFVIWFYADYLSERKSAGESKKMKRV